jgi:hypothetical protein
LSTPETTPTVTQLKQTLAGYISDRAVELVASYPYEPGNLKDYPCTTLLSRRFDPTQAETGPHDDTIYEWRLRLYVSLNDYEKAQEDIDWLIPIILDVPRHHPTMEGAVDFLVFFDPGLDIIFSKDDGWAAKDLIARVVRTEL